MNINDVILEAREYAIQKHKNLYGGQPYIFHLDRVLDVASKFSYGQHEVISPACILHDVLEDTPATTYDLRKKFGNEIASTVFLVTDKGGSDLNRFERHKLTYPHIRGDFEATVVKLSDRIANCEVGSKNDMYRQEYPYFKEFLYVPGEHELMWAYLDTLLK